MRIKKFSEFISIYENFDYHVVGTDGIDYQVSKEDFLELGAETALDPNQINIDIINKKIIANFGDFQKD